MTVREFILQVANGTLFSNDILAYASKCLDKHSLLWDLRFAYIAVDEASGTGKPLVTDDKQIDRLIDAIELISKQFNIMLVEPDPIPFPQQLNTERAQRYFRKAITYGLIEEIEPGVKYKFNGSDVLCACFCGIVYCYDVFKIDPADSKYKFHVQYGGIFREKALNNLFNIKTLSQKRSQANECYVENYQIICDLIEAAD